MFNFKYKNKSKNKNKEKFLNSVIALTFLISATTPISAFAEAPVADNSANVTANATNSDLAIQNNVLNNGTQNSLGQKDLNATTNNTATNANGSKEDELVTLNKAQIAKYKANQQENTTSQQAASAYSVTNAQGEIVTVQENPCYNVQTTACQAMVYQNVVNSSGVVTSTRNLPNSSIKYITSNNQEITANMESQIMAQKAMTSSISQATSTTNSAGLTASYISSAMSTLSPSASFSDRLEALGMALLASQNAQKQIEQEAYNNQAIENISNSVNDVANKRVQNAQSKRDVLKQTSKRYTAKITPSIPTTNDGKDVTITLVPTDKNANADNYDITATFLNVNTNKMVTLNVLENVGFTVEEGYWTNRPNGSRTVKIIYKFKNSSEPETSTITYKVGDMATAILPDGRNVSNSVTSLVGNADILNYNQLSQGVAGRITKAKWVNEGDASYCALALTDSKDNASAAYEVSIMTNNVPQEACNDSLVGQYANFSNVSSKLDANGQYIFEDVSSSDGVNYDMNETAYDDLENKNASDTQTRNQDKDITALKVDPETGKVYEALPGELGVNYLYFPSWGRSISIYKDEDGTYSVRKADGTEYSDAELSRFNVTRETLNNLTFATADDGTVYAMSGGEIVSGAFDSGNLASISKSNTISALPAENLTINEYDEGTNFSGNTFALGQSGIVNQVKSTVKSITSVALNTSANIGSLFSELPSNVTSTSTNALTNTNSIIENTNVEENIVFQSKVNEYCAGTSAANCTNYLIPQIKSAYNSSK